MNNDEKREIDQRDLNNEMAERETGRLKRFLPNHPTTSEIRERKEREAFESRLRELLRDPQYSRLYQDAWDALNELQASLDRALIENAEAQERLERTVEELEDRAATLPDGTKVFRGRDGHYYGIDGHRLSGDEAEGLINVDRIPDYDAYLQAKWALDKSRARGAKLAGIQGDIIDPARRKLTDEDNPPTPDDLRTITKTLKTLQDKLDHPTASVDFEAAAQGADAAPDETRLEASELSILPRPNL